MCEFQDELNAKELLLIDRDGDTVDPANRRELSDIKNLKEYNNEKNRSGLSHEEIIKKYTNCLNQVIQRVRPAGGKGRKRSYNRKSSHSRRSKRSSKKSKKNKRLILYGLD